jgi:hypothetical protein
MADRLLEIRVDGHRSVALGLLNATYGDGKMSAHRRITLQGFKEADPPRFSSIRDRLELTRTSRHRNTWHADLFLTFPGLDNVVGRLHTHQRIHIDSERLLDA